MMSQTEEWCFFALTVQDASYRFHVAGRVSRAHHDQRS